MRRAAAFVVVVAALLAWSGGRSRAAEPVELLLVLAVDCSHSVDDAEFQLQAGGIAAAIQHPAVLAAIEATRIGIALAVMQWSGARTQVEAVPWTIVRDAQSARAFATKIAETGRLAPPGSTAVGAALAAAQRLLERAPYAGRRRVIDVSGDGMNNQGEWPDFVRPRVLAAGITINGLAIENEEPGLGDYYRNHVTGGAGAFVLRVRDYAGFAEAMGRKLLIEIAADTPSIPARNALSAVTSE